MSYERRGPGAPPGGTVYWLAFELSGEFLRAYKMDYAPHKHNYRFVRYNKRTVIDEFLVVRTSKKCYRVIYFNAEHEYYLYFSARNYKACAKRMIDIYHIFKRLEIAAEQAAKPPEKPEGPEKHESLVTKGDKGKYS